MIRQHKAANQLFNSNPKIMAELISNNQKAGSTRLKKMPVRVDLTAMVDLAFLLITFFMLTTSLTKPKIIPVIMPAKGPSGPVSEHSTMTICLGKNNQALWFLGQPGKSLTVPRVIKGELEIRAAIINTHKQVLASGFKSFMVLIKPDEHALYENLVNTLDEMKITDVPSYAIAPLLPKETALLKQNNVY